MVASMTMLPPLSRFSKASCPDSIRPTIPVEFICPLSLEIMSDPVILASGQTYERRYIEKWLEHGHHSCPKTRQELPHKHLCPNQALRTLIADWCRSHHIVLKPPSGALSPSSPSTPVLRSPRSSGTVNKLPGRDALGLDNRKEEQQLGRKKDEEELASEFSSPIVVSAEEKPGPNPNSRSPGKGSPQSVLERRHSFGVQNSSPSSSPGLLPLSGRPKAPVEDCSSSPLHAIPLAKSVSPPRAVDSGSNACRTGSNQVRRVAGESRTSDTLTGQHPANPASFGQMKKLERTMSPLPFSKFTALDNGHDCMAGISPSVSGSGAALDPLSLPVPQDVCTDDALAKYLHSTDSARSTSGRGGRRRAVEADETPYSKRLLNSAVTRRSRRISSESSVCEMRPLVERMQSGSREQRRDATASIRIALKDAPENRMRFIGAGGTLPLIRAMQSDDVQTVEHAITAGLFLSLCWDGAAELVSNGGVRYVVDVLRDAETEVARSNAAAVVFALTGAEENKRLVWAAGVVEPLIALLESESSRSKKDACLALYNLSYFGKAAQEMISMGVVERMVEILEDCEEGVEEKVAALMGSLAKHDEGREAIMEEVDAIYCLVDVLEGGSDRAKEHAAICLFHLAKNCPSCIQKLLSEGCLPPLVKLANAGSDPLTGKRVKTAPEARELLTLMRSYCNKRSASLSGTSSNSSLQAP